MLPQTYLTLFLAPLTTAVKVEIIISYVGQGTLALGGGSIVSESGVKFRIDGGTWTDIDNAKSNLPCAFYCKNNKFTSAYTLGYLGGRKFYICQDGGGCIPGNKFTAKVKLENMEQTCESSQKNEFLGFQTSTTSSCGVTFDFDDTPDKRDLEDKIMRAITWEG